MIKDEKAGKLSANVIKNLKCTIGLVPRYCGLLKIYKTNLTLRPIFVFTKSPLYYLSKYQSKIKPVTSSANYSVTSPYKFLENLC